MLPRTARRAAVDDALRTRVPAQPHRTDYVAARAPRSDRAAIERYARRLGALPGVVGQAAGPGGRGSSGSTSRPAPALGEPAKALVRRVRAVPAPGARARRRASAAFLDQQKALSDSLPLALAILATTTLVILFLMTGSVVLPVKALVMNLLTVSAAFGLLVLIFQDGHLEGLLGFTSQGALESTPAGGAVRRRVRALHRLRRVPAHAHQGGARPRRYQRPRRWRSGSSGRGGS